MSRFSDYEPDDSGQPQALYRQALESALVGRRGQAALRDLEAALLALPSKRLIYGALCQEGEVCALGALAQQRQVEFPDFTEYTRSGDDVPAWEFASWAVLSLGLRESVATEIQWQNDWKIHEGDYETPEMRYERVLTWVRERLAVVVPS